MIEREVDVEGVIITYHCLEPEVVMTRMLRDGLDASKYFVGPITTPVTTEYPIKDFRTGIRAKQVTIWKRYCLEDPELQMFWISMFLDGGAGKLNTELLIHVISFMYSYPRKSYNIKLNVFSLLLLLVNKHQRSETLWMMYDSITREGFVAMFMPSFGEYDTFEDEESELSAVHRLVFTLQCFHNIEYNKLITFLIQWHFCTVIIHIDVKK